MRTAVAVLTACILCGCSFVFVTGPSDVTPIQQPPRCTTSPAVPMVDWVVGTATGLAMSAVLLSVLVPYDEAHANQRLLVAGGLLVPTVGFATSSVIGHRRVGRCREASRL